MSTANIDRHVAVVLSDGTLVDTLHPLPTTGAGGGSGGAVTVADGADSAEGFTTDAAVQGDNPGTISAKLRGLNKSVAAGVPVTLLTALDNTNDSIDVPGHTLLLQWTPTITSGSAYAAGFNIGGANGFTGAIRAAGLGATVRTILIADKAKQNAAIDLFFLNVNSPLSTYTDHAAQAINAAELVNLAGYVSVLGSHYANFSANSLATAANLGLRVKPTPGTTLYLVLVCRGTPTYASTSDLSVTLLLEQN